jgi:hypothetical protein
VAREAVVEQRRRPLGEARPLTDPLAQLGVVRVLPGALGEGLGGEPEKLEDRAVDVRIIAVLVVAELARLVRPCLVGHARRPGEAGDGLEEARARRLDGEVLLAEGAPVVQLDRGVDRGDVGAAGGVLLDALLQQTLVQFVLRRARQLLGVEGVDVGLAARHALGDPADHLLVPQPAGGVGEVVGADAEQFEDLAVEARVGTVLELADQLGVVAARLVDQACQSDDARHGRVRGASGGLPGQVHLGSSPGVGGIAGR